MEEEKTMKSYDLWLLSLVFMTLVACYESKHLDIPDKAEVVPEIRTIILESSTPAPSACEIENEQLKDEADSWREKYYSQSCDCDDYG